MSRKKDTKKDPMHIDFLIELYRKEGNFEKVSELKDRKKNIERLNKLGRGDVITFEELVNLPEGYEYISSCSGSSTIEKMSDLKVEDGIISWSESTGDPRLEIGTGDVRNIPHCSDDEYEFTLYHINKKK